VATQQRPRSTALIAAERLQPALLDRLVDEGPRLERAIRRILASLRARLDRPGTAPEDRAEVERLLTPETADDDPPLLAVARNLARLDFLDDAARQELEVLAGWLQMRREFRSRTFALSREELKRSVLEHLENLLNTPSPSLGCVAPSDGSWRGGEAAVPDDDGADGPASTSVVNYGIPPVGGKASSEIDLEAFEEGLKRAIEAFEPRLRRGTVRVRAVPNRDLATGGFRTVAFVIEAELWGEPVSERLLLRSELDLEAGTVTRPREVAS
jgi:type VI secretion system lysozyme-like protein